MQSNESPTLPDPARSSVSAPDPAEVLMVDIAVTAARLTRLAGTLGTRALPRAMVRALSTLEEHGPLRISEFAEIDGCSQPSATALIGRLTAAGLAARTKDPDDSRAVVVELTPAGREQLSVSRRAFGTALAARLPDFGIDRLSHLESELTDLLEALKSAAPHTVST
ncbi:MarR family winged helix-turn-helix transcriptional regulator [Nocardia mikamii]|uniref:MarR family winged helix-turn-helix transcriptional regulator n=1 Tax=Nocardia mikamii TaxID=508464 RepID=UPI000A6D459A|nr:MarR family transcriptional regulator [Nocardia mikamii]